MVDGLPFLRGRRLAVVGGALGIGRACVEIAAASGAQVAVVDVDAGATERLLKEVGDATRIVGVHGDATRSEDMVAAAGAAVEAFGGVDAVVNIVGGATPTPFLEVTPESWRREIEFNLQSAFAVAHAFLPHLVHAGDGALVNASSGYGVRPKVGHAAYSAAKAGVIGLTRTLALEFAPQGVRVNAIAPGATDTPRVRELLGEQGLADAVASIPLGRIARPEDCAMPALFLASPAAAHITGQVLHVNGGIYMA